MLCRVFHRSKESSDNIMGSNIELSHRFMLETTTLSPPSSNNLTFMSHVYNNSHNYDPLVSSTTSSGLHQNNPSSTSNSNFSSLFHLLHNHLDRNLSSVSSKVTDDTCGFFWGDGVSSNNNDPSGLGFDLDDDGAIFQ